FSDELLVFFVLIRSVFDILLIFILSVFILLHFFVVMRKVQTKRNCFIAMFSKILTIVGAILCGDFGLDIKCLRHNLSISYCMDARGCQIKFLGKNALLMHELYINKYGKGIYWGWSVRQHNVFEAIIMDLTLECI